MKKIKYLITGILFLIVIGIGAQTTVRRVDSLSSVVKVKGDTIYATQGITCVDKFRGDSIYFEIFYDARICDYAVYIKFYRRVKENRRFNIVLQSENVESFMVMEDQLLTSNGGEFYILFTVGDLFLFKQELLEGIVLKGFLGHDEEDRFIASAVLDEFAVTDKKYLKRNIE